MGEFKMPSLGADMEDGTLVDWKVQPGDTVHRGDIIADVETDKGVIEIEVFEDGVVQEILVEAGSVVPVGTVLAIIGDAPAPAKPATRTRVTPIARKLANEHGIDLGTIVGTGAGGAITRGDVLQAVQPSTPKPARAKPEKMRLAISAAMARSNREIPHYYLETHIDMKASLDWLSQQNRNLELEERMLPVAILLKAVARALADVPDLNGYWNNDALEPSEHVHIGLAIALRRGGLITPAIHHVDERSVHDVMSSLRDVIARARSGQLKSSELTDATITVTNLGDLGVETVHGVIYPPQVALVGFGKITERPWAVDGMLGVRPIVSATLAGDHRATDGRRGAQFLDALNRYLQEPDKL